MSNRHPHQRVRTVSLDHDQLMVFSNPAGTCIEVLFGGIWLTEERCAQDRVASAGHALQLQCKGRAVAESIGPTRLRVIEPARRFGSALRSAWQRWRPQVTALAPRSLALLLALVLGIGVPELIGRAAQQRLAIAQQGAALDATERPATVDRVAIGQPRPTGS